MQFQPPVRHPLHVIVDLEATRPGCLGKLWLGGELASGDVRLMQDNGITIVQPASRKPAVEETMNIKVLPYIDGTALAAGDTSLESFLGRVDDLIRYMIAGHGVLICCKNGAHRSATEVVVVVMRLTGWDALRSAAYVSQLRNIVDLESTAPPSAHRRVQTKPIEFLVRNQEMIVHGHFGMDANHVVSPIQFRNKAREVGFMAIGYGEPKVEGARPKARPKTERYSIGASSGYSSFEMVPSHLEANLTVSSHDMSSSLSSSAESAESVSKRAKLGSGEFLVVKDPLKSKEARAQQLANICVQLTELDAKLLGHLTKRGSERPPEPKNPPKSEAERAAASGSGEGATGQVAEEVKEASGEGIQEATDAKSKGTVAEETGVKAEKMQVADDAGTWSC